MKISLNPRRRLLCALAALSILLPTADVGTAPTAHAEGVQLDRNPSYFFKTPVTKPLWSASVDHEPYAQGNTTSFAVDGGILV